MSLGNRVIEPINYPITRLSNYQIQGSPMPGGDRISVMCVENHGLVREGLCLIVNRQPDMYVVASAASGEEAVAQFKAFSPDVTLMDLDLEDMSGVDAI